MSVTFFVGVVAVGLTTVVAVAVEVAATGCLTSGSLLLTGMGGGVGEVTCTGCDCCCSLANLFNLTSLPASSITAINTAKNITPQLNVHVNHVYTHTHVHNLHTDYTELFWDKMLLS